MNERTTFPFMICFWHQQAGYLQLMIPIEVVPCMAKEKNTSRDLRLTWQTAADADFFFRRPSIG